MEEQGRSRHWLNLAEMGREEIEKGLKYDGKLGGDNNGERVRWRKGWGKRMGMGRYKK